MMNHLSIHSKVLVLSFHFSILGFTFFSCASNLEDIIIGETVSQVDIYEAGPASLRIVVRPIDLINEMTSNPALSDLEYSDPAFSVQKLGKRKSGRVGNFRFTLTSNPLTLKLTGPRGRILQQLEFSGKDTIHFAIQDSPILGLGEGGPRAERGSNWREHPVEFDRRGRVHEMQPRWQSDMYGSRNPVPMLLGTDGWGLFVASPWVEIDLTGQERGSLIVWDAPGADSSQQHRRNQHRYLGKGKPPVDEIIDGYYEFFVFDGSDPAAMMKDISVITGPAVLPPMWALGYMQSHRTLENDQQLLEIVDTFRDKEIPIDAVIYLGTGFCPSGWNEHQPSYEFNPNVFNRDPKDVISDMHDKNVRVIVHMVPWDRDSLPTLHGNIPALEDEILDESHIEIYWEQHTGLVKSGIDAFWPDEGDWFNLHERIKRHQMYYVGPISTKPDERPWSLHRNGYLGVAKWGGWVWSGDTQSAWKTLEAQIAVGINHSLSLSPYWGSDIGGFYPNPEYTGELFARWFQFAAFCPSFRSHGRTWWTHLPWGWGLSDMGPMETNNRNDNSDPEVSARRNPMASELNNPAIEPAVKKFAQLRYQLMPYVYTLAWQARDSGMPLMRSLWLHYPGDENARILGDQFLFGPDMLIAPVYEKSASTRRVYLPEGNWYDWWSIEKQEGGKWIEREVDLNIIPIYVREGAILPYDPVRQYTSEKLNQPTTLKIFTGESGEYDLYEDDGISLEYLNGQYTLTRFRWNDDLNQLTIEPVITGYSGQMDKTYRVELVPQGTVEEISYSHSKQTISF